MAIPTVRVEHDGFESGFVTINEEDYDPEQHVLYDPEKEPAEDALTYDLAKNGVWTIYEDGEEAESGRGQEELAEALSEREGAEITTEELQPNA